MDPRSAEKTPTIDPEHRAVLVFVYRVLIPAMEKGSLDKRTMNQLFVDYQKKNPLIKETFSPYNILTTLLDQVLKEEENNLDDFGQPQKVEKSKTSQLLSLIYDLYSEYELMQQEYGIGSYLRIRQLMEEVGAKQPQPV